MERVNPGIFYETLASKIRSIADKGDYIRRDLVPRMEEHRKGHGTPSDSISKLYSDDPNKPGEFYELMFEIIAGKRGTFSYCLEVADIIYYLEKPSGWKFLYTQTGLQSHEFAITKEVEDLVTSCLGVPLDRAMAFCILKYETRMQFDDVPGFKKLEEEFMEKFLQEEAQARRR